MLSVLHRQLILVICVLCPLALWAEGVDLVCDSEKNVDLPRAEQLLKSVQTAYKKVASVRSEFDQASYLAALEVSEPSGGEVFFVKPGMMKWDYDRPEPQTFTIRDNTLYLYQPRDKQVLIDKFQNVLLSDLPVAFLMGLGDLPTDFEIKSACESGLNFLLALSPRSKLGKKDEGLKSFTLMVRKSDLLPSGARVVDVAGNVTTIRFKNSLFNEAIAEQTFATNYPRGTDINDRRNEPRSVE